MADNKKRYFAHLDSIKRWYGSLYFKNDEDSLAWLDNEIEAAKNQYGVSDPNYEICKVLGAIMERKDKNKEANSNDVQRNL